MPAGTLGRVIALAGIAVILAAGLCVFDAGHAAHGDLCLSFLGTAVGLALLFPLAPIAHLAPALAEPCHPYPPDLPAPPPKA
jgi:hypothetical protein